MAQRIASLLSAATEILFALGLADRVVAVSHECDWPPEANRLPRVTMSHIAANASSAAIDIQVRELSAAGKPLYGLDVELLGQLAPDLIVTQQQCDVCAVSYADVLAAVADDPRLAACKIVALNPLGLADVLADVRRIGEAAGATAAAEGCVAALESRIEAVSGRTAGLAEKERRRFICIEWIEPLMLAANWVPEIVELAGGRNGLSIGGRHSTYHAWPDVVAYDPEVIVVSPCGFDLNRTLEEAGALPRMPGWAELNAVRSGRVYGVDGSAYLNRSGPRLVDSLEILGHLLHPGLIAAPAACADGWRRIAPR